MGGSAIGGGEWLMGPAVTARYGGALMWLATLSILGQVIYNLEISRYTLYSGEPIFTGKFRMLPGPRFWLTAYLILDFGSVFPYLAANAATPLAAVILGKIPDGTETGPRCISLAANGLTPGHADAGAGLWHLSGVAIAADIRREDLQRVKAVMTFKIVTVFGFLTFLAIFFSTMSTCWRSEWAFSLRYRARARRRRNGGKRSANSVRHGN